MTIWISNFDSLPYLLSDPSKETFFRHGSREKKGGQVITYLLSMGESVANNKMQIHQETAVHGSNRLLY